MKRVLDHGYLVLEEWMGGDSAVLSAARHCYQSPSGDRAADERLMKRLMRDGHLSVFEHAVMRWQVKAPLFVARQWMRHRHASISERSLRYTVADREYYAPEGASETYLAAMEGGFEAYEALIAQGMRRGQARGVLGTAVYTSWVWTVNASSFMHWLDLRLDKSAQWEHRQYAEAALDIWGAKMPIMAHAYLRNRHAQEK